MEYGCIGEKLSHSFSKTIHNMIESYDYQLVEIAPENLSDFFDKKDFKAINVTIPYKQDVIKYLDYTDSIALEIGAVNTIVNRNGKLYGYNTDFSGMSALIKKLGIEILEKTVAVLGSGGTSKTAQAVAKSLKAKKVVRVSRSAKDGSIDYAALYDMADEIDIIINTTPCGMYPNIFGQAVDIERFKNLSGVVDAVYNPLRTCLVSKALERGIKAGGGLYMLVSQAVFAAEHFTGKSYPDTETDRIFDSLSNDKENVVLIGMAGCGKTTLGKSVAKALGREFFDSDDEIVKKYGDIPTIFKDKGEAEFRRIEKEVIQQLSAKNGCVIATGGGAVLDSENVFALKMNGRVVFLDRALENIPATPDRPLSCDREKLTRLWNERYPIYLAAADIHIKTLEDIKENTDRIINECFN